MGVGKSEDEAAGSERGAGVRVRQRSSGVCATHTRSAGSRCVVSRCVVSKRAGGQAGEQAGRQAK